MREDAVGGTEEPATEVAASRLLGSWFGELGVPPSWQVVQQSVWSTSSVLFGISGLHKAQLKTPIIIKLLRSSDSREEINYIMGLIHQI